MRVEILLAGERVEVLRPASVDAKAGGQDAVGVEHEQRLRFLHQPEARTAELALAVVARHVKIVE